MVARSDFWRLTQSRRGGVTGSSHLKARLAKAGDAASELILVVDDDPDVRVIVAEYLEETGFDTIEAENGISALRLLDHNPRVKLIISDIRMPQMSGIELAKNAQRRQPGLPVILISGYFLPQQVGFRFLHKPFHLVELRAAIDAELGLPALRGDG
jgi:CheY-like chemotaxis protein